MSEIIVSGMRPTGKLHLGNFHGALKNFVALQDKYKQDMLIFYKQLVQEYQYPVTQEMQHWYNTVSK